MSDSAPVEETPALPTPASSSAATAAAAGGGGLSKEELAARRQAKMAALMAKQQAKATAASAAVSAPGQPAASPYSKMSPAELQADAREFLGYSAALDSIPEPAVDRPVSEGQFSSHTTRLLKACAALSVPDMQAAVSAFEADVSVKLNTPFLDAQAGPRGETPLSLAVDRASAPLVDALLRAKASPDGRDLAGLTPLMRAAATGQTQLARELLKAGADPSLANAQGWTAVMHALQAGHAKLATELVRAIGRVPTDDANAGKAKSGPDPEPPIM